MVHTPLLGLLLFTWVCCVSVAWNTTVTLGAMKVWLLFKWVLLQLHSRVLLSFTEGSAVAWGYAYAVWLHQSCLFCPLDPLFGNVLRLLGYGDAAATTILLLYLYFCSYCKQHRGDNI